MGVEKNSTNPPTLAFRFDGLPPRKTAQQKGMTADPYAPGGVRVFTRDAQRMEGWWMRAEFARQLPAGWTPPAGETPARVRVELVYPLRKTDRADGEELIPHTVKPDADNLVKSIMDAATRAGVWGDDAQVYSLTVRKWRGARPRWAVFVWFEAARRKKRAGDAATLPGFGLDAGGGGD